MDKPHHLKLDASNNTTRFLLLCEAHSASCNNVFSWVFAVPYKKKRGSYFSSLTYQLKGILFEGIGKFKKKKKTKKLLRC